MISQIIENTFNHLLATDYQGKQRLCAYQGKSIGIEIKPAGPELIATVTNEGLSINAGPVGQADCTISGTPIALIRYMNASQINPSTNYSLGIEIDGDLEFAREISGVLRSLDVDWEEIFSKFIGDAPAYQLSKLVSAVRSEFQRSKDSARSHLRYLIADRMDQIVTSREAEAFYRDVDKIAVEAARLEQKINLLTSSENCD